jgi:hypothetical protein
MKQRCPTFAIACLICLASLAPSPARAWNSAGHMIVAIVAYEEMNEATRAKALELLRAHPRFEAHFERVMPRDVSRLPDADQQQWIFAHSGTWPDLVRDATRTVTREDVTAYNRPFWHYINQPVFLSDAEGRRLEPELKLYVNRQPPDEPDEENMNIIQAVKNSMRIVGDDTAPPDKRSVHLCWLNHLTGDSHQPLHSAALYTARRFRNGDRGGNDLQIEHAWKLHAFWDDQVCSEESFATLQVLAKDLRAHPKKAEAARQAAAILDIEKWIDESYDIATRYAYTPEVLQKVAAREDHTHLGPLDLAPEYRSNAETVAERRAAESGFRLARLLESLLSDSQVGGNRTSRSP